MELITAFKASDGKIFEDELECKKYDAKLAVRTRVETFLRRNYYHEMGPDALCAAILRGIDAGVFEKAVE